MARFNVGDYIQTHDGKYRGKITDVRTVYKVADVNDNGWSEFREESIELAPKLTPETAWDAVPAVVIRVAKEYPSKKEMRYQAYQLLGGAGVKVTEEVKARVRKIIANLEDALGMVFYD